MSLTYPLTERVSTALSQATAAITTSLATQQAHDARALSSSSFLGLNALLLGPLGFFVELLPHVFSEESIGGILKKCSFLVLFYFIYRLHYSQFLWDLVSVNATFNERDISYEWMLSWIYSQAGWHDIRSMGISTSIGGNSNAAYYGDVSALLGEISQKIYTLPTINKTYHLITESGHHLLINRRAREANSGVLRRMECTLEVCMFTRNTNNFYALMHEAREKYMQSQRKNISIYYPDRENRWRLVIGRGRRPLSSVVLDVEIKEKVVQDVKEFLASRQWYNGRGIPYRRGYLFHGKPGTGKTSLIQSLAGAFELDVYTLSLGREGMDDGILIELINAISDKAILLLEDIDAAFTRGISSRVLPSTSNSGPGSCSSSATGQKPTKGITLSGLLNVIDGFGATDGRILIATTNYRQALDEALLRKGRIDREFEFNLATKYQAREIFKIFYRPESILLSSNQKEGGISLAMGKLAVSNTDADPDVDLKEKDSDSKTAAHVIEDLDDTSFTRALDTFVENFPEDLCSPADIQDYLLGYKTSPEDAAANAANWVQSRIEARWAKEGAKGDDANTVSAGSGKEFLIAEPVSQVPATPLSAPNVGFSGDSAVSAPVAEPQESLELLQETAGLPFPSDVSSSDVQIAEAKAEEVEPPESQKTDSA